MELGKKFYSRYQDTSKKNKQANQLLEQFCSLVLTENGLFLRGKNSDATYVQERAEKLFNIKIQYSESFNGKDDTYRKVYIQD